MITSASHHPRKKKKKRRWIEWNGLEDKLSNEVVSNLYMFCSRMLNKIHRDVIVTGIVTIDGKMFLTNTIIKEEFLHPQKLGAVATDNDVFNLYCG